MKIKFWGVRGSIPTPGKNTTRYGGNTPCIEVLGDDGTIVILDSGTGIRALGESLAAKSPIEINLCISHTHWDHIHGFPFFIPAYIPNNIINIFGPSHYNKTLKEIMAQQMAYSYFPVLAEELRAKINYTDLKEELFNAGSFKISTKFMNHPVTALGYRIEEGDKKIAYTGDHEPYYNFIGSEDGEDIDEINMIIHEQNNNIVQFVKGVDVLISDAHYLEEEYAKRAGWGHSSIFQALNLAINAGVKHLVLFHHEPARSDDEMDMLTESVIAQSKKLGQTIKVTAAIEGEEINI
jgi:phosphoribosyl 1,2-cyclic phosphodiesterase